MLGTCVSALGFILIIIIIISGLTGSFLLLIALPLLGNFVVRVVSIQTRNIGGKVVGGIAFISYLVGFELAMTLILLSFIIAPDNPTMQSNINDILIKTITRFTIHSIFSGAGFAGGGFVAYRRAVMQ